MIAARPIIVVTLLAATVVAGGLWWQSGRIDIDATSLAEDGIGPLRLGKDFQQAERLAFRLAPETAFSGIGCSGMDEIRFEAQLGDYTVDMMGMAGDGRIQDIEATLIRPNLADSLEACLVLRDRFARVFVERFGEYTQSWQLSKPVSQEHLARTGPVLVVARWFRAGGSCYVSAHFRPADGAPLRPDPALLAALD
jgi:hypothetical protein